MIIKFLDLPFVDGTVNEQRWSSIRLLWKRVIKSKKSSSSRSPDLFKLLLFSLSSPVFFFLEAAAAAAAAFLASGKKRVREWFNTQFKFSWKPLQIKWWKYNFCQIQQPNLILDAFEYHIMCLVSNSTHFMQCCERIFKKEVDLRYWSRVTRKAELYMKVCLNLQLYPKNA